MRTLASGGPVGGTALRSPRQLPAREAKSQDFAALFDRRPETSPRDSIVGRHSRGRGTRPGSPMGTALRRTWTSLVSDARNGLIDAVSSFSGRRPRADRSTPGAVTKAVARAAARVSIQRPASGVKNRPFASLFDRWPWHPTRFSTVGGHGGGPGTQLDAPPVKCWARHRAGCSADAPNVRRDGLLGPHPHAVFRAVSGSPRCSRLERDQPLDSPTGEANHPGSPRFSTVASDIRPASPPSIPNHVRALRRPAVGEGSSTVFYHRRGGEKQRR